jgi:aryl-alcohol dehydrogenase-like predicted oxidoreductase
MDVRPLGRSGLRVTEIGLGLAALGRPGYINLNHADDLNENYDVEAMRAHTHTVLDAAFAAGIRYFDVARSYGRAEEFLRSWLDANDLKDEHITVGSKWGYTYTADWQVNADTHEVKEHSLDVLNRQWQESQDNLGEHLNLYQIHSATLESGVLENTDVLNKLRTLRNEHDVVIGLSLSGENQAQTLNRALQVHTEYDNLFGSVQATWNILERSAGDALKAAHHQGLGVIIKEGVANGRLTAKNDNPDFAEKRRVLEEQARRLGITIDALALAAILHRDWVDMALSGAATIEQLQANVQAAGVPYDDEAEAALLELVETPAEYWSIRSDLDWN